MLFHNREVFGKGDFWMQTTIRTS